MQPTPTLEKYNRLLLMALRLGFVQLIFELGKGSGSQCKYLHFRVSGLPYSVLPIDISYAGF